MPPRLSAFRQPPVEMKTFVKSSGIGPVSTVARLIGHAVAGLLVPSSNGDVRVMRRLNKWWGGVAVCTALAGAPAHGAMFLPTAQLSGSVFAPGESFDVTIKLAEEFTALSIDLRGAAMRDGAPVTGVFAETPPEIPFSSTVLLTAVPDDPNPPIPVTGFFPGTGYFEFASVVIAPTISVEDTVYRFSLTLLDAVAPGDYVLDFLLVARNAGGVNGDDPDIEDTGMAAARFSVADLTQIPEPSAWALMLAGLAGLGVIARRRIA
jgi:hypothetical protein